MRLAGQTERVSVKGTFYAHLGQLYNCILLLCHDTAGKYYLTMNEYKFAYSCLYVKQYYMATLYHSPAWEQILW
jgi:hypothetical protein